jgi:hypothetical protein
MTTSTRSECRAGTLQLQMLQMHLLSSSSCAYTHCSFSCLQCVSWSHDKASMAWEGLVLQLTGLSTCLWQRHTPCPQDLLSCQHNHIKHGAGTGRQKATLIASFPNCPCTPDLLQPLKPLPLPSMVAPKPSAVASAHACSAAACWVRTSTTVLESVRRSCSRSWSCQAQLALQSSGNEQRI